MWSTSRTRTVRFWSWSGVHLAPSATRKLRSLRWMATSAGSQRCASLASIVQFVDALPRKTYGMSSLNMRRHVSWPVPAATLIWRVAASTRRTLLLPLSTTSQNVPEGETRTARGRERSRAQQVGQAKSSSPVLRFMIRRAPVTSTAASSSPLAPTLPSSSSRPSVPEGVPVSAMRRAEDPSAARPTGRLRSGERPQARREEQSPSALLHSGRESARLNSALAGSGSGPSPAPASSLSETRTRLPLARRTSTMASRHSGANHRAAGPAPPQVRR